MVPNLLSFLSGAVAMGFALCGLGFLGLWRRAGDRLFLAFAGAFWLLMVPALAAIANLPDESESSIYLLRVAAYLLIIGAITLKNKGRVRGFARRLHRR